MDTHGPQTHDPAIPASDLHGLNIAIVGATGAVGQETLRLIAQRYPRHTNLKLLASHRSAGRRALDGGLRRNEGRGWNGGKNLGGKINLRWGKGRVIVGLSGRGVAQPGSAPAWGAGGRQFESGRPDHLKRKRRGDERNPSPRFFFALPIPGANVNPPCCRPERDPVL